MCMTENFMNPFCFTMCSKPYFSEFQSHIPFLHSTLLLVSLKINIDFVINFQLFIFSSNVSDWSNYGMTLISTNNKDGLIECETNHMTYFAVIFNARISLISSTHIQILTAITYIGVILSTFGAVVILITYMIIP